MKMENTSRADSVIEGLRLILRAMIGFECQGLVPLSTELSPGKAVGLMIDCWRGGGDFLGQEVIKRRKSLLCGSASGLTGHLANSPRRIPRCYVSHHNPLEKWEKKQQENARRTVEHPSPKRKIIFESFFSSLLQTSVSIEDTSLRSA